MDRDRLEAWTRFIEQMSSEGASWPRGSWFAAVEDALAAALPADSALLAHFRQDVAELTDLERLGSTHDPDGTRQAQLDAQIQRLVALADEIIRGAPVASPPTDPTAGEPKPVAAVAAAPQPLSLRATALSFGAGLLLVVAGAVGANYQQSVQIDRQLAQMQQRFDRQLAELEDGLSDRLQAAEMMRDQLGALRDELRDNVDGFNAVMAESVTSLMAISDSAIAELERRLTGHGSEIAVIVDRLRERAGALDRSLDQISGDMAGVEQRLPQIARGVDGLDAQAGVVQGSLDRATAEASALADRAPELESRLRQAEADIEQVVDGQRTALETLGTEMTALRQDLDQAQQALAGVDQTLAEDLARAKQSSAALEAAVQGIESTRQMVDILVSDTRDQLAVAQWQTQQELDQMLSTLAEKADLAVLRSEDVMQRAAVEGERRIDAEVEATREVLAALGETEIEALTRRAKSIRTELQQTRSGLLISWQRMDQVVAERQSSVLAALDRHAGNLEERVEAFVRALDVMVAAEVTPTGG